MATTHSIKDEFSDWMLGTLTESKADILAHSLDIVFDVNGNIAKQKVLDKKYLDELGKSAGYKKIWMDQNKKVNEARDARYTNASAIANGVSSYMGEKDQLSIIIHQKRGSLVNIALRGKKKP